MTRMEPVSYLTAADNHIHLFGDSRKCTVCGKDAPEGYPWTVARMRELAGISEPLERTYTASEIRSMVEEVRADIWGRTTCTYAPSAADALDAILARLP